MTSFISKFKGPLALSAFLSMGALGFGGMAEAARSVELKNMAVRLVVEPQAREDVDLKVDYNGQTVPKITVRTNGDKLIADGQLNLRGDNGLEGDGVRLNGGARIDVKDLPVVRILVPMDVRVTAVRGVYMAEVGKAQNLNLDLNAQGIWNIAEVEGETQLALAGEDRLQAGQLQALAVKMNGAGSVDIDRLNGPLRVTLDGVGAVSVREGASPKIEVAVNGVGQVRFEGVAQEADLNVTGVGSISVRKVTGPLRKRIEGAGAINIGH